MEQRLELITSEKGIDYLINITCLLAGIYGLFAALDYTYSAQVWPLNVSILLIITGTILLFRNYVPGPLQAIVRDESLVGGDAEEETMDLAEDEEMPDDENIEDDNVGRYEIDNAIFTTVTMFAYALVGWLAGLLWATPVFVAFYCWWFQKSWKVTFLLAVISFAVAFAFFDLLFLRIDEGVLTEYVIP